MESNTKCNTKKIVIYGILTFGVMLIIFLFSSQDKDMSADVSNLFLMTVIGQFLERILPPVTGNGFEADIREYAHMFEYGCLGISMSLLFREIVLRRRWLAFLLAEVGCFLYACSDEFHQTFVPGRVGTFADVGVDAVGFTTGVVVIVLLNWIFLKLKIKKNPIQKRNSEII